MSEETEHKTTTTKKKRLKRPPMNWRVILVIILVVGSLSVAFYFWNDSRSSNDQSSEAIASNNQEESDRVLDALNLVLYTESDSQPTVARIESPEVLQEANPDFYKNAQAGDYLILYPQRAVIFRESENRVINVAPIINTDNLTGDQQEPN